MAIFGKLAYAANVSPAALLLVRFTLAAGVLAMLLLIRPELRHRRARSATSTGPGRATLSLLVTALGLGAVGYATQACLYFAALERMDASLLSLVFYTYPLLVTLTAVMLGRDRLTRGRCMALAAASCGTLLVLLGTGGMDFQPLGVTLAFGAAVAYTGYILVADTVVHRLPPALLAALVMRQGRLSPWPHARS
jgi:drug/metabolite transporter (DMT)-like permease